MSAGIWLTCALLLVVGVSGCVGGEAVENNAETSGAQIAQVDDSTGAIQGTVTDDSLAPIAGAQAQVKETGATAVSDLAGHFIINGLPPGEYNLFVAALGFEAVGRRVAVTAGEVEAVSVQLAPLAVVEPHEELFIFRGFFGCSWQIVIARGPCFFPGPDVNPSLFPEQNRAFYYNVWPHWRTIYGELVWQQNSLATGSTLSITLSYANRTTGHWWSNVEGTSPLTQRCDRTAEDWEGCDGSSNDGDDEPEEIEENGTYTRHFVNTGTAEFAGQDLQVFGMAFQQRFELYVTNFYWEGMPEGYSAVPD